MVASNSGAFRRRFQRPGSFHGTDPNTPSSMQIFLAELLGTMLLIIFGDGVVANVVLSKNKGQNSGWIVITTGWAMAVTIAVYAVGAYSGAHINPAVTIALVSIGKV